MGTAIPFQLCLMFIIAAANLEFQLQLESLYRCQMRPHLMYVS